MSPFAVLRVRMREYSRDRSVETSRYTAQFPKSAQLQKLQKFDMATVQQQQQQRAVRSSDTAVQ